MDAVEVCCNIKQNRGAHVRLLKGLSSFDFYRASSLDRHIVSISSSGRITLLFLHLMSYRLWLRYEITRFSPVFSVLEYARPKSHFPPVQCSFMEPLRLVVVTTISIHDRQPRLIRTVPVPVSIDARRPPHVAFQPSETRLLAHSSGLVWR